MLMIRLYQLFLQCLMALCYLYSVYQNGVQQYLSATHLLVITFNFKNNSGNSICIVRINEQELSAKDVCTYTLTNVVITLFLRLQQIHLIKIARRSLEFCQYICVL